MPKSGPLTWKLEARHTRYSPDQQSDASIYVPVISTSKARICLEFFTFFTSSYGMICPSLLRIKTKFKKLRLKAVTIVQEIDEIYFKI